MAYNRPHFPRTYGFTNHKHPQFLPLEGEFIDIYLKGPRQDGLILEKIKEQKTSFILNLHFVASEFNLISF